MLWVLFFDFAADNRHLVRDVLALLPTGGFTIGATCKTLGLVAQIQVAQFVFDALPALLFEMFVFRLYDGRVGGCRDLPFIPRVFVFESKMANTVDGLMHMGQSGGTRFLQKLADLDGRIFFGDF